MDDIYNYNHKQQAYALYGTLLGDATLLKGGFIRIKHGQPQRDYIESLEVLFKAWGLQVSTTYDYTYKSKSPTFGNHGYSEVRLKMTPTIARQVKRLYNDGKKIVRSYVLRRINPLGLLLWWLDDGSFYSYKYHYDETESDKYTVKRHARLSTNSFSDHEKDIISRYLKSRFSIDSTLRKVTTTSPNPVYDKYRGRAYSYHAFSPASFRRFIDVVYPVLHFTPESMIYKLNMAYELKRKRKCVNSEFADKYNFNSKAELLEKQKLYCVGSSDPKSGASHADEDIV
jgi:hypothetical protein